MPTTNATTQHVTILKNQNQSEFGSDLLNELANLGSSSSNCNFEKTSSSDTGKKSEILTTLVIELASNVIIELLKLAAKRLANHPQFDPLISLNINGQTMTLQSILDSPDSETANDSPNRNRD